MHTAIDQLATRIPVESLYSHGTGKSYENQITKFHLWNLTAYSRIAYFDSDHFFLRSPEYIFTECPEAYELCATKDIMLSTKKRAYLNGGMLVLRPSREMYTILTTLRHMADNRTFAEQDMLNDIFRGKWHVMSSKWNQMHVGTHGIKQDTVAIHEKYWVLRDHLRWTSNKSQPWVKFY